jgi:hypothetical protein
LDLEIELGDFLAKGPHGGFWETRVEFSSHEVLAAITKAVEVDSVFFFFFSHISLGFRLENETEFAIRALLQFVVCGGFQGSVPVLRGGHGQEKVIERSYDRPRFAVNRTTNKLKLEFHSLFGFPAIDDESDNEGEGEIVHRVTPPSVRGRDNGFYSFMSI